MGMGNRIQAGATVIAALLLSIFLASDQACTTLLPQTFTNAGTVSSTVHVCANIDQPWCGVTYGFEHTPDPAAITVTGRTDLPGVDITQPPTFPFTLAAAPVDLGFTSADPVKPIAPVINRPIASYLMTHTGRTGITYALRLRTRQSAISVGIAGDCVSRDTPGPQYVEVPLDGKLPPPAVLGIKK